MSSTLMLSRRSTEVKRVSYSDVGQYTRVGSVADYDNCMWARMIFGHSGSILHIITIYHTSDKAKHT